MRDSGVLSLRSGSQSSIGAARQTRQGPSEYFDWGYSGGGFFPKALNTELTIEDIRSGFSSEGRFLKTDVDGLLLFEYPSGEKVSFWRNEQNPNLVRSIDFYRSGQPDSAKRKFFSTLSKKQLKDKVFRKNPYFEEEKLVQRALRSGKPFGIKDTVNGCEFLEPKNGVVIVPDNHGNMMRYNLVKDTLDYRSVDWFGIEMIPHTMQETVNSFISADEGSNEYKRSRTALINYFGEHWNSKFGELGAPRITDGSKNPYFHLLESARKRKIKVYALDTDPDYYGTNPQIHPLVVGTRNLIWARQLPKGGRGIVFGGVAHFNGGRGNDVQDYYHRENPGRHISQVSFSNSKACELNGGQKERCQRDLNQLKSQKRCEGLSDFRCLRKNASVLSSLCAEETKFKTETFEDEAPSKAIR